MATAYKVFFNRQVAGSFLPGGTSEPVSKAATESGPKSHRKYGTEGIKMTAPIYAVEAAEITAENAEAAACAAVHILGANEGEGELWVATAANVESKSGR